MFASLKNKIRDETGSDLSKLTAKITSSTVQKIDNLRGKSHQGSTSSLNSIISSDGFREEGPIEPDEFRRRIAKIELEFSRKLEQKEHDWRNIVQEKDRRLQSFDKEKDEAYKQITNLKEALRNAEDLKQKILEHKENSDQMENLQTVELSKVKRLVLEKDRELSEKTLALKEVTSQLEKLRAEIGRLQRQEETLSDVQEISKTEIKVVKRNMENVESELEKTEDENSKLKISVDSEHLTNDSLRQIITKLERELGEEKSNSLNVQKTLTRVTSEKNTALLRNAEISQQMELVKQDMRRQEKETKDLSKKLTALETENASLKDIRHIEQKLNGNIADLEEQLSDKNKTIKMLQLRLADLKKTLQQELRTPGNLNLTDSNGTAAILQPSQTSHKNFPASVKRDEDDVNFKYLKHVVIKFLTSREYEAQHLIKAISTLLKFSPEEEKLIHETLEWKKSWFGSKPKFTNKKSVSFASS